MTIASSNVKMSDIATEITAGGTTTSQANLSLKTISGKNVKTNVSNNTSAGSTFALGKQTWPFGGLASARSSGIVTSAQGTGKAGLNTESYALSEWIGYDPKSHTGLGNNTYPVIRATNSDSSDDCFGASASGCHIYCKKISGVIIIYAQRVFAGNTTTVHNEASNGTTLSSGTEVEIGRLEANTSGHIPTGCTMSFIQGTNSVSGNNYFFGTNLSVTTVPLGSNSTTNLGSTKIGYKVQHGGVTERGSGSGSGTATSRVGVRFTWTWPTSPSGDAYNANHTEVWVHLQSTMTFTGNSQGC